MMHLEYRILWFEDQIANIKPYQDNIRNAISRLGFNPKIETREVVTGAGDPLADLPLSRDVDLVMMDWKLGGGFDGAKLAKRLKVYYRDTDMVFYSSESAATLRRLIFDQDIDGVFCFHRTNLSDRTIGLVQSQLRKMLDLNHMRGIVMAATSDLDQAMIECLEKIQPLISAEDKDAFVKGIGTKISESLRSKANEIDRLMERGRLDKLLKEPSFGAALRLSILQDEIAKIADRISEVHLLERLALYRDEVIGPRNDFAHRRAVLANDQLVLEGRTQPFTQESMIALRLKLLSHFDNLSGLISLLAELGESPSSSQSAVLQDIKEDLMGAIVNPDS
ncbi:hypothetical protein [Pseudomonas sp. UW4]|uniref:hypothetical protein n=1 Tax=Pseudomonas sp. UW4 TaxID=1207075 RepID=UPI00029D1878|nr:hypothetical protein [Pseudomonas sp. UW4]AFY21381.1 hypothetical protein PputUW4_04189 [Pseudomonas sp. UW4]